MVRLVSSSSTTDSVKLSLTSRATILHTYNMLCKSSSSLAHTTSVHLSALQKDSPHGKSPSPCSLVSMVSVIGILWLALLVNSFSHCPKFIIQLTNVNSINLNLAPEPLARLYSRGFYRSTWINTALDAGFATAAPIPLKWLRDILSILFSGYYLIYANEADEKLRRYRAVPTVISFSLQA